MRIEDIGASAESLADQLGRRRLERIFGVDRDQLENPEHQAPDVNNPGGDLCKTIEDAADSFESAIQDMTRTLVAELPSDKGMEKAARGLAAAIAGTMQQTDGQDFTIVVNVLTELIKQNKALTASIAELAAMEQGEDDSDYVFDISRDRAGYMTTVTARKV